MTSLKEFRHSPPSSYICAWFFLSPLLHDHCPFYTISSSLNISFHLIHTNMMLNLRRLLPHYHHNIRHRYTTLHKLGHNRSIVSRYTTRISVLDQFLSSLRLRTEDDRPFIHHRNSHHMQEAQKLNTPYRLLAKKKKRISKNIKEILSP